MSHSPAQIAQNFLVAWVERRKDDLNLADDVQHSSPVSLFNSKEEFLDACWESVGSHEINFVDSIEEGNRAVLWYEIPRGEQKPLEVSEWYTINDHGQIQDIKVFFDTANSHVPTAS